MAPRPEWAAWLGETVDQTGTIAIARSRQCSHDFCAGLSFVSADRATIRHALRQAGVAEERVTRLARARYCWRLNEADTVRLLAVIGPYLKRQQPKWELVARLAEQKAKYGPVPYGLDDMHYRMCLWERCRQLDAAPALLTVA
jgi:hypothetical protein